MAQRVCREHCRDAEALREQRRQRRLAGAGGAAQHDDDTALAFNDGRTQAERPRLQRAVLPGGAHHPIHDLRPVCTRCACGKPLLRVPVDVSAASSNAKTHIHAPSIARGGGAPEHLKGDATAWPLVDAHAAGGIAGSRGGVRGLLQHSRNDGLRVLRPHTHRTQQCAQRGRIVVRCCCTLATVFCTVVLLHAGMYLHLGLLRPTICVTRARAR